MGGQKPDPRGREGEGGGKRRREYRKHSELKAVRLGRSQHGVSLFTGEEVGGRL